jgi:hypothetical protein
MPTTPDQGVFVRVRRPEPESYPEPMLFHKITMLWHAGGKTPKWLRVRHVMGGAPW